MTLRRVSILALTVVLAWHGGTVRAADVTLNASDVLGTSSFAAGTNWSNGQPPSAGNNYLLGMNRLRTPPDANSYVFGGDTLVITPNTTTAANGGLMYKGTGNTGIITINNLNLAGGIIHHQNGNGDLFQLAGNINVTANSSLWAKQGTITISAPISGTSNLSILATDDPAQTTQRFVNLAGVNTFTGNFDVIGKLGLTNTGSLRFNIGANGVNNTIGGTGIGNFDGAFDFNLTGASATPGNTWNIATVATRIYGENFTVNGFDQVVDGVWVNGAYTFTEATGVLAVAPPQVLSLVVNKNTGAAALRNLSTVPITLDYYEVTSDAGALNPANGAWNSLSDQGFDAGLPADFNNSGGAVNGADLATWRNAYIASSAGGDANGDGDTDGHDFLAWQQQLGQTPGPGDQWGEAGGSTDNLLVELRLNAGSTLAPGQTVNLGTPFRTSVFGPGADGDLAFRYALQGSNTFTAGLVQYVTSGPATSVPEPGALGIAIVGLLAMAAGRRSRTGA